ncbi:MAG: LacI family transcriptional regulator [Opitutaceae bacterium]|nr:LacI family transcriptional regulator [Opitutaceae bacterium]
MRFPAVKHRHWIVYTDKIGSRFFASLACIGQNPPDMAQSSNPVSAPATRSVSTSRPTQKDIARALGLTQATVSMALRGDPLVSPATRERVSAIARQLGYVPDPYLTGLAAYRHRKRPVEIQAGLAWLSNDSRGESWKRSATFSDYHAGAVDRARQLGYVIEDHALHAPRMTPARVESILLARGINGLLVAPQPAPGSRIEGFLFDRFSSVTFGYTLASPKLHLVTLHQFRAMETAVRRLRALGYTRIGLALASDSDERADNNWSAAFWSEQRRFPKREQVAPLFGSPLTRGVFLPWLRKCRPDVVLTIWPVVYSWMREAGLRVPEDAGYALLSIPSGPTTEWITGGDAPAFSGITENPRAIGAKAVELLVDAIHRGERGAPALHVSTLIEGTWVDGQTVRSHKSLKT